MSREVIQPAGTTPGGILSPGIRVGNLLWTAGSTTPTITQPTCVHGTPLELFGDLQ